MGYIGNEPVTGHFPVQTNLVGPGPTYTLDRAPATAGAIEVSVQGVLQPTTAYSVSGTTLTMAGVTAGVPLFIRYLGETLILPTVADGSVTLAKMAVNSINSDQYVDGSIDNAHLADDAVGVAELSATGTASSSTFLRGDNAWATAGSNAGNRGTYVELASGQTLTTATNTKIAWSTENYDVGGDMDIATNERFTVPSGGAGKYYIGIASQGQQGSAKSLFIHIYKNGTSEVNFRAHSSYSGSGGPSGSIVLELADTDYIEMFAYHDRGSNSDCEGGNRTFMSMIRID